MGWDAIATYNKKTLTTSLRRQFKNAADKVRERQKSVDMLLGQGGLDCSACAIALTKATGMNCYGEPLTVEQVREFQEKASWPEKQDWAIDSAKIFLEICAKNGLEISFSW